MAPLSNHPLRREKSVEAGHESGSPTSFVDQDVEVVLKKLTDDEKMALLGAPNWWSTTPIPRLGIPPIRMSDGPNGVRGTSNFLLSPSQCIPCATSLAATFDPILIEEAGAFLAKETKMKTATALLAPTCNIQRNPLGGRAFESFSEDPLLSGNMAAAYVDGLQKNGVAATIKHFVCNDTEHERTSASSELSARALREIYLYPFMIAQRDAKPLAIMTSYNRVSGVHVSEDPFFIGEKGILRKEWGFDGLVMSDWFGTYGLDAPIKAGLDLEMPGPPRWRTPLLLSHMISCKKLSWSDIQKRVLKVLQFKQPLARLSPEVVFGDSTPRDTEDTPEVKAFNRKLAASGMVLLKNRDNTLPLKSGQKIAIIGPNAKGRVVSGGGSAFLKPSYVVTPWEGTTSTAPEDVEISYAVGCYAHKLLPTLDHMMTTADGRPGWEAKFYSHDQQGRPLDHVVASYILNDTRVKLNDFQNPDLTPTWTLKLHGVFYPDQSGPFEFGLVVCGRAKLWVDGVLTIDNWTKQRPGGFFYGQGAAEEKAVVNVTAGTPIRIDIEYDNTFVPIEGAEEDRSNPSRMLCVRLGGCLVIDPETALEEAVELARSTDIAVIVAGLTAEWEAEGSDRPTLDLPGRQHELIEKVVEANPRTVIVIQAGSATSMPYADRAAAILQAWYSGNECGNALADVLFGRVNPSGKLPITFPKIIDDIGPAAYNTISENGKIHYREDIFVGYRHYVRKADSLHKPLFPFGFGLSYTTFSLSQLEISPCGVDADAAGFAVSVSVAVTNTGELKGSEVVQVYVSLPSTSAVSHPHLQLRAFSKVHDLAPGETRVVRLELDKYAISYWDEGDGRDCWIAEKGRYGVSVGTSLYHLPLKGEFVLKRTFSWSGV